MLDEEPKVVWPFALPWFRASFRDNEPCHLVLSERVIRHVTRHSIVDLFHIVSERDGVCCLRIGGTPGMP